MVRSKKNKELSNDQLGQMIQRGFSDLEERLGGRIDGVEKRLDGRINSVETRLGHIETDLKDIKQSVKSHEVRITRLEYKVGISKLEEE